MEYTVRCPIVTPFDDDGAVDVDSLAALVDRLVDAGIDGLVPCGTSGEFTSLTDEERRVVIETTVDAADGQVPVMAGVGGTAVEAVRERIRTAADVGADAALVVAPYYGGDADDAGNEAFFEAVADDASLPLSLYNIPDAAGQELSTDSVVSLAERGLYEGVKDSSGDMTYFDELLRRTPDSFPVYQGWDAGFVPALAMGADGGINAVSQLFLDPFTDAAEAIADGNVEDARRIQLSGIDPVFRTLVEHGFAPAVKTLLSERGIISSATVRPPHVPIDDEERTELAATLDG